MRNLIDLHTHSVLCDHAYSTITENIDQALKVGLKYYGISEHQTDGTGIGASIHALLNINRIPRIVDGITVLYGCEYNILEDGIIELNGIKTDKLDYGIASIHHHMYKGVNDIDTVTNMYLKALDYDYIQILGHINQKDFPCDYKKVILKAKSLHKLVEINNSKITKPEKYPEQYEGAKEILNICKETKQPIIINSDAHMKYEVGNIDAALKVIAETNFPNELIINYNEELFKEYFKIL